MNAKNALGIFEEGYYDVKEDLNLFYQNFSLSIPQNTQPNVSFVDQALPAVSNPYAAGEFSLDVELAYPIVYPQKITLFPTDDTYYVENSSYDSGFFNTFLDALDGVSCLEFLDRRSKKKWVEKEWESYKLTLAVIVLLHILCLWRMWERPRPRSYISGFQ